MPLVVPADIELLWPRTDAETFKPRPIVAVSSFAASTLVLTSASPLTVPAVSFAPSIPVANFAFVTASLAMAFVFTALFVSSLAPIALAAICSAVML